MYKTDHNTFDFLIIGAGSAGCVLAERLSRDGKHTVALFEAGGEDTSTLIHCPAGLALLAQVGKEINRYQTVPQAGLNGRRGYQPRGKVLGGSSSINAMIYARGHAADYDHWASAVGEDPSTSRWGWNKALETFKAFEHNEHITDAHHGSAWVDGQKLNVKNLTSPNRFGLLFLEAANEAGYKTVRDFNGAWMQSEGFGEGEAVGAYQVTHKDGERYSAAKAFLTPNLGRKNLTVITHANVMRILLETAPDKPPKAIGLQAHMPSGLQAFYAAKEVLLCAGALQSPQVLMLSGIGDAAHLQSVGVKPIVDLKGVGQNLHDHIDITQLYDTPHLTDLFGLSLPFAWKALKGISEWRKYKTGLLTTNFAEAGGFIKSTPSEPIADLQLHFVIAKLIDHGRKTVFGHGFSCHVCVLRPQSRGAVTLQSNDPQMSPLIDPAFLSDQRDLDKLVLGFKHLRRILQSPSLAALRGKELLSADVQTDAEIEAFIRARADTIYHPVGTCKMGTSSDPIAVVDSELKVRGVEGLRVVDASIMPRIVGGNTNAPTMMIAQTAADVVLRDL